MVLQAVFGRLERQEQNNSREGTFELLHMMFCMSKLICYLFLGLLYTFCYSNLGYVLSWSIRHKTALVI